MHSMVISPQFERSVKKKKKKKESTVSSSSSKQKCVQVDVVRRKAHPRRALKKGFS